MGHEILRRVASILADCDPAPLAAVPLSGRDLFQPLYEEIVPRRIRHVQGEYYTPAWLAERMLEEVEYSPREHRLLDPACGSGVFLLAAIRRCREAWKSEKSGIELAREIVGRIAGLDLNPVAVLTARANCLLALGDLVGDDPIELPVHLGDSILGTGGTSSREGYPEKTRADEQPVPPTMQFDRVVGNPPWISWDDLPDDYREATKPLWRRYGLFTLSAKEARHGGGKKDLSILMLYAVADRYLRRGGRLAMIVPQTLFQTKGAGDGFRRFRLGDDGHWLGVLGVNDLVDALPFSTASNWTATVVLEKGTPTQYPVPYRRWSRGETEPSRHYTARPIHPGRPTSPWLLWPADWPGRAEDLIGPSDYEAHLGANTGGANGVYWVRVLPDQNDSALVTVQNIPSTGKRSVPQVQWELEPELLYPLVRWSDVARYRAVPSAHLLMPQDPATRRGIEETHLRERCPRTHAYLERFREALTDRTAYRRYQSAAAFYSMYDVGPYTLAPFKVVWRRMDRRINAAVVGAQESAVGLRPVVPQETCVLVAAESLDEAHYLCGLLNSSVVGFVVEAHSVRGGKGFGTPSMLEYLRLRRYRGDDGNHRALAAASREAHAIAARQQDLGDLQRTIDGLAAEVWGIGQPELAAIERERGQAF
jgi:hypothetical protein